MPWPTRESDWHGQAEKRRRFVPQQLFAGRCRIDIAETDPTAGLEAHDRGIPRDRTLTFKEIETLWKWLDTDALSLEELADTLKLELLTQSFDAGRPAGFALEGDRSPCTELGPPCLTALENGCHARHADGGRRCWRSRTSARSDRRDLLFLLEKGVVVTSVYIGHYLSTRRTTLPIAVFTSHDFRRTFATMLTEMGIALDLVAAIVGQGNRRRGIPAPCATMA